MGEWYGRAFGVVPIRPVSWSRHPIPGTTAPPMSTRNEFRIPVPHQGVEHVSAILDTPDGDREPAGVFVLAHGAGAAATSDFLEAVAPRIADTACLAVLRFNYAYAELMIRSGKPRPPERRAALDVVQKAVHSHARETYPGLPLIAGGKSLGGRMASLQVAEGEPADALCFLGYPLHPPGKKDRLRTAHFPDVKAPSLFLQGTRDALCDLDLLRPALATYGGKATLHVIEDADHSFSVLKRTARTPEEVLDELASTIAAWRKQL